jgi:eukaryotic-like serine/threonine-protein kinase
MYAYYQPGKQVDHYQILRLLGQGVSSRVYLAQDLHTQQQVVLKFPLDDLIGGAAIFKRYQREGEIGKLLDHPTLQRHLSQGELRQEEYLVLEYLHGRTLRQVIREQSSAHMDSSEALRLLLPVCEALVYAHAHGVIHRDIKPENLFLLDTGEMKLIDFGIALLKTGKPHRHFSFQLLPSPIGTPAYMSSERLRGAAGDERTDVYAVGVVLYELLCGRVPFEEQDAFSFINAHRSDDPPSILQWNPNLSPALVTVVMRAIRRDPEKRYVCMQDLLHDLSHLDAVTPLDYLPDPPKPGGRYRYIIRIGLIVLGVCLFIIAFGLLAQFAHHAAR